jgi:hypothetical protein
VEARRRAEGPDGGQALRSRRPRGARTQVAVRVAARAKSTPGSDGAASGSVRRYDPMYDGAASGSVRRYDSMYDGAASGSVRRYDSMYDAQGQSQGAKESP